MIDPDVRARVLRENPVCVWCGIRPSEEAHHGIIGRKKGHPEFDVYENLAALCHICNYNKGVVDSFEFHDRFGWFQLKRGIDVISWYNSLNLRVKDNFSWLNGVMK